MSRTINLFSQVTKYFNDKDLYDKLILSLTDKYDLKPYKISKIYSNSARKIHSVIKSKYERGQFENSPNLWFQNQRRLFVWFIICYQQFSKKSLGQMKDEDWKQISKIFNNKNPVFLEFQYRNLIKTKGRPQWSKKQDQLLRKVVNQQNIGRWNQISKQIFFISDRQFFKTPKHCRERWFNHLDKSKAKTRWTASEDSIMLKYILIHGKKWAKIVHQLNNARTQHMIKNRFHSLVGSQKFSPEEEEARIKQLIDQRERQQTNKNQKPNIVIKSMDNKMAPKQCEIQFINSKMPFSTSPPPLMFFESLKSPSIPSFTPGGMCQVLPTPDFMDTHNQNVFSMCAQNFKRQMTNTLQKNDMQIYKSFPSLFSQQYSRILEMKSPQIYQKPSYQKMQEK